MPGTKAYITFFDFEGNKVENKQLKYLEVDPSCALTNIVLPAQKNQIYVEDNQEILSFVDLTNKKWNILKVYEFTEVSHPLAIYQNKCLTIRSRVGGRVSIHMFDLETQDSECITFDLYYELMKQGNYTLIGLPYVTFNQNWGACFSLVNQSNQTTPNSSQILWISRYNFDTGESLSFFQTGLFSEFDFNSQFKISDNGNFAFIDQVIESNRPYGSTLKDTYLIDFQNRSFNKGYLETNVGQTWIEDKYIYYTDIDKSNDTPVEYYLYKYDITTHEVETIAKTGIRSQKIFVLDDYIVFLHLGRS
ncbi:MAG: hypothetical protein ACFFBQ_21495, partial [Promethearchaeota archaeon]